MASSSEVLQVGINSLTNVHCSEDFKYTKYLLVWGQLGLRDWLECTEVIITPCSQGLGQICFVVIHYKLLLRLSYLEEP
jgi:hypothetical protein